MTIENIQTVQEEIVTKKVDAFLVSDGMFFFGEGPDGTDIIEDDTTITVRSTIGQWGFFVTVFNKETDTMTHTTELYDDEDELVSSPITL